jgi:hypothetical protein
LPGAFLVVTRLDIPAKHEEELNDFFREELFASLLSSPEVLGTRCFRLVKGEGPRHMVICEVGGLDAVESGAFKGATAKAKRGDEVRSFAVQPWTMYEEIIGLRQAKCEQWNSKYLLFVQMDVPPELEAEFNDWYDKEHLPLLMMVPGWLASRRFRRVRGNGPKYMTMYELESPSALNRREHKRTHETRWYRRLRPQFRNFSSLLYEQLYGLTRY